MQRKWFLALASLALVLSSLSVAQTLTPLVHQPPDGILIAFQLTDGTVMVQGNAASDWYKLTPDITGSYVKGTWTRLPDLPSGYVPYAFASAVLADGRLIVEGGEYNNWNFALTNQGAVYNPLTNTWTKLQPPPGWGYIGDSPSSMLPDNTYIIGDKLHRNIAILNPKTMKWKQGTLPGKTDFNSEEGWTLMPDGTILTADVRNAPNSEKYVPSLKEWVTAGSTIVDLHSPYSGSCLPYGGGCYHPPGEIGPAILRPDGTVFATGSTPTGGNSGHTSIYTPGANPTDPGTWTPGPNFPRGDNAGDSFAALLPNGNVLVLGVSGTLYEFDGTNLTAGPYGPGALMVLPTGEVLVGAGSTAAYSSSGTYSSAWQPTISSCPTSVTRGSTYQISGTQFNGLSQANAFGDEMETATNYPLVRITNQSTGHVFYARTHDHSTMGVATGSATVSTNFDVPASMETGASTLVVVANGIPSQPFSLTVN